MGTTKRLGCFVDELIPCIEPRVQWLEQLLKQSIAPNYSALSGTNIGFLVCVDSRVPDARQFAVQIHTAQAAKELAVTLEAAGDVEHEIAKCLREIILRSNIEEPWKVAIGAATGVRNHGARLYVGAMKPQESESVLHSLAEMSMWFPPPQNESLELVDRIRTTSTLMGVSRRVGSTEGHLLYFAPDFPLTDDLIAYVTAPLGKDPHRQLTEFIYQYALGVVLSPKLFGWGLAIDRDGRFQSLKLEVSKYFESFENIPASSRFFEAADQISLSGAHNNMLVAPGDRVVSCRWQ